MYTRLVIISFSVVYPYICKLQKLRIGENVASIYGKAWYYLCLHDLHSDDDYRTDYLNYFGFISLSISLSSYDVCCVVHDMIVHGDISSPGNDADLFGATPMNGGPDLGSFEMLGGDEVPQG